MSLNKPFLGRGWSFPPTFHKQGKTIVTEMVEEEDDINQSLAILFSTRRGERLLHNYGADLSQMVFEEINESSLTELKDRVEKAVLFYEPRIDLLETKINASQLEEGILRIELEYKIRSTNSRHNMVYPFYIKEGSNIKAP